MTTPYRPLNPRPKIKPLHIHLSESGEILRIDWTCDKCEGKGHVPWNAWEGCQVCRGKGVIDGITRAIYLETTAITRDNYDHKPRSRSPQSSPSILGP